MKIETGELRALLASERASAGVRVLRPSELLRLRAELGSRRVFDSPLGTRTQVPLPGGGSMLVDEFGGGDHGACCLSLRLPAGADEVVRFGADGDFRVAVCASGGWLLDNLDRTGMSYWIPRLPMLRTMDAHDRILGERPAALTDLVVAPGELAADFSTAPRFDLHCVVWCFPAAARDCLDELALRAPIEAQRTYLWSSRASFSTPADVYAHLIDGRIYQNAWAWPRKWKFCCELDGFEMFVWLKGLELQTGKGVYNLLRRQLVMSVITRQAADGGWYHGEWTDGNECHFRFHTGALLLLANAFDEWGTAEIGRALRGGVEFAAAHTDQTDLGLWFLHDTLELSAAAQDEMRRQTGPLAKGFGDWIPTRVLGKSPANKLVFNTHLDTTVALQRYRSLTGETRFDRHIESARQATLRLLRMQPLDVVYRPLFAAIALNWLPGAAAGELGLVARALRRLASKYLAPNLHLLKRRFPRIVMPGGYLDRHIAPLHLGANYHAVNTLDLVRHLRQFPGDGLEGLIEAAAKFMLDRESRVLRWLGEAKQRQFAVIVFAEAMYQMCMLRTDVSYRAALVEAVLQCERLGLGLPPSALGGNSEVMPHRHQRACPVPSNRDLRTINLSGPEMIELLVVNPNGEAIGLDLDELGQGIDWTLHSSHAAPNAAGRIELPARGWLRGMASRPAFEPGARR